MMIFYTGEVIVSKWTKHIIEVKGFPVKAYVNSNNTEAVLFFLFGRYMCLRSDINVLDFTTNFLVGRDTSYPVTYSNYLNGQEDTAVIQIDKIA